MIRRIFTGKRLPATRIVLVAMTIMFLGTQLGWPIKPTFPLQSGAVSAAPIPRNDRLGFDHISYGGNPSDAPATGIPVGERRYQLARDTGAGWNRWALYWNAVEERDGVYNYSAADATVAADRANGFQILGVFLSTPKWASTAPVPPASEPQPPSTQAVSPAPRLGQKAPHRSGDFSTADAAPNEAIYPPKNLYAPVFSDGTDNPGPGKTINPENYWARFVYQTALRYRGKVDHWEIWNEPDFNLFWQGTIDNYRRLLKVGYLAAKAGNPKAIVIMGGMAHWFDPSYFPRLLDMLMRDPTSAPNGYYFDATSWHWYSKASQLYERTLWVKGELSRRGLGNKAIWVTEAGFPICGDPALAAQPACIPGSHKGTLENQAAFVIQAAAYGFAAGVERMFFFQLFDDAVGPLEYYGFIRNNGTLRPAYGAFQVVATYFQNPSLAYRTPSFKDQLDLVTMYLADGRRVRTFWNNSGSPLKANLPAEAPIASWIQWNTTTGTIRRDLTENFLFDLGPATLDDEPGPAVEYILGGPPNLIVEDGVSNAKGSIKGVIRTRDLKPVQKAFVVAGSSSTFTDDSGSFNIPLLPGMYDVDAQAFGYFPAGPGPSVAVRVGRATELSMLFQLGRRTYLPIIFNRVRR